MDNLFVNISIMAIPILLAITLHEAAHGYVANYFGDPTAKRMGRLSLNPIRHIDPIGTIVMPLVIFFLSNFTFTFGYAKPVPVMAENLRNPKTDMIWVALAGPAANILLALIGGVLILTLGIVPGFLQEWFALNLSFLIYFNCLLAIFNMMPLPPLDGGRVVTGLLPGPLAHKFASIERYGFLILVGVIFILPRLSGVLGINVDLGGTLIFGPARSLYVFIVGLFSGGGAGL